MTAEKLFRRFAPLQAVDPMLLTFYIIRNAKRSPCSLARKEVERR